MAKNNHNPNVEYKHTVRMIDYSIFSHNGTCIITTIYRGILRTTKVYTRNIDDAIVCAVTVHQNEVDGWKDG